MPLMCLPRLDMGSKVAPKTTWENCIVFMTDMRSHYLHGYYLEPLKLMNFRDSSARLNSSSHSLAKEASRLLGVV